jgi:hypothetical protein
VIPTLKTVAAIVFALVVSQSFANLAYARDAMRIGNRTYTTGELEQRVTLPAPRVPGGLGPRSIARIGGARHQILLELPNALGMDCDLSVSEEEIAQYAKWWDSRLQDMLAPAGRSPSQPDRSIPGTYSPLDGRVRSVANREIVQLKRWACIAARYPTSPFGEAPVFPAPGREVQYAPLSIGDDSIPVDACLSVIPWGAFWDMLNDAERRGVLEFSDGSLRRELSTSIVSRPRDRRYPAASCLELPPWRRVP